MMCSDTADALLAGVLTREEELWVTGAVEVFFIALLAWLTGIEFDLGAIGFAFNLLLCCANAPAQYRSTDVKSNSFFIWLLVLVRTN
jgi:hypothetical protein